MSRTTDKVIELQWEKQDRIDELLALLDAHDCHMSSDSGCECEAMWQELTDLGYPVPMYAPQDEEPY